MPPILSVVVATRNRPNYANELVKDVLSFSDDRVEVVIADNSDDDTLSRLLKPLLPDSRLKFRYDPSPKSAIQNFNDALSLATGVFVCLLGDDDGLHSQSVLAIEWAQSVGIDCLIGSVAHEYIWPAPGQQEGGGGRLTFPAFSGASERLNCKGSISDLLRRGGTAYLELKMPRLYHGFVRRAVLEDLKESRGYYVEGLSPDIYAAVTLSQLAPKVVAVDYPLTIPGVCAISGTATEGKRPPRVVNIKDAPHLRLREGYKFSEKVPPLYSVDAIWADSACLALKDLALEGFMERLDVFTLSAYMLRRQPALLEQLLPWLVHTGKSRCRLFALLAIMGKYCTYPLATDFSRLTFRIARAVGLQKHSITPNLATLASARRQLESTVVDLKQAIAAWRF